MLVKSFPEYFGTYKIYETVRAILEKNMRKSDISRVESDLEQMGATPETLLRSLGQAIRKHVSSSKASSILLSIKNALAKLIDVEIEPKEIMIKKNGKEVLKVRVSNNLDDLFKVRVGIKQIDRTNSSLIHHTLKGYGVSKMIKSAIIKPGQAHTFKFIIKPDIFDIGDLYELRKNKKLDVKLGVQVEMAGIDGLKTPVERLKLTITE